MGRKQKAEEVLERLGFFQVKRIGGRVTSNAYASCSVGVREARAESHTVARVILENSEARNSRWRFVT